MMTSTSVRGTQEPGSTLLRGALLELLGATEELEIDEELTGTLELTGIEELLTALELLTGLVMVQLPLRAQKSVDAATFTQ